MLPTDGFDLRPLGLAVDLREIQPRYRLQLWLEAEDNAIDSDKTRLSESKERLTFQVVSENEVLSEIADEEQKIFERMSRDVVGSLELRQKQLGKLEVLRSVDKGFKDPEFQAIDEELKQTEVTMEKVVDAAKTVLTDYERIGRELRLNRMAPSLVDRVKMTIVQPLQEALSPTVELADEKDPERDSTRGHIAWAQGGLENTRRLLEPILATPPADEQVRLKASEDVRKSFVKAQARLDLLIKKLTAIINAMEGISDFNKAVKKAQELEEQERLQADAMLQLYEFKLKIITDELFGDPKKKPPQP